MTADKTMAIAYEIARSAHPEHYDKFKADFRAYTSRLTADTLPVLYRCALLIADALEEMDKNRSKPSKLTAAKRIATNASRDRFHGLWADDQGRTCICDGYRAVRLTDTFASIPVIEAWPELSRVFADPINYTRSLELPTATAVKKAAAEQRAANGRTCVPAFDFGDDLPMVNCDYLLDLLALMPGCTAFIADRNATRCPIYFKSENGDAILLPVNKSARR